MPKYKVTFETDDLSGAPEGATVEQLSVLPLILYPKSDEGGVVTVRRRRDDCVFPTYLFVSDEDATPALLLLTADETRKVIEALQATLTEVKDA